MLGDRKVRYGDKGAVDRLWTWAVRIFALVGVAAIVLVILTVIGIAKAVNGL